jgi:glycosyltransferase involved in cell wall biosynthesis
MTDAERPIDMAESEDIEENRSGQSGTRQSPYVDDLISVIIPVRNGERFILRTLQSVLNQSYQSIEVIVVDDGSTDSTLEIVEKAAAHDARIRHYRGPQSGVAAARNSGIAQARGEFIAPVDADDLWHKDKLLLQRKAIAEAGARTGVAYCWSLLIDEADSIIPDWNDWTGTGKRRGGSRFEGNVLPAMLERNFLGNSSTPLIRHACLDSVGGYDPSLYLQGAQGAEDWKIYLALAEICEFAVVPRCLIGYRKSQGAMSGNFVAMQRSMELVRQWAQDRWPFLVQERGKQERYLTNLYLAYTALASNSLRQAGLYCARAIQAQPAQLVSLRTLKFMLEVVIQVLGARSWARRIWTPVTFWEFVEHDRTLARDN